MKRFFVTILLLIAAAGCMKVGAQTIVSDITKSAKGDIVKREGDLPLIQYGPRIGLTFNTQMASTNIVELDKMMNGIMTNPGVELGGFVRFNLMRGKQFLIYLQPEAMFTADNYFGGGAYALTTGFDFMARVGLGYRFNTKWTLRADFTPVIGVNTGGVVKTDYADYQADVKRLMRKEDCGWRVNLGVDYKKLTFDLHYNNQFKSKYKARLIDNLRNTGWGVTFGYLF